MKKGFLRIICILLMGLLLLPPMVLAEDGPKITISKPEGEIGDIVQVVFSAENMPACSSLDMRIWYDDAFLKPVGFQNLGIASTAWLEKNMNTSYEGAAAIKVIAASFAMTGTAPVFSGDTDLFAIDFEIIGATLEEHDAKIEIAWGEVREDNAQTSLLGAEFASGYVRVAPLMGLMLKKPAGEAMPGEKVPVEVIVQNYSPLSGLSIGVTYDPAYLKLEEEDIIAANLPGLTLMTSLQNEGDLAVAKIVWMGAEDAAMEETFTALTLNFTAIQQDPQEDTELFACFLEGGMVNNQGEFKGYQEVPSVTTIGLAKLYSIAMKTLPDLLDYPQNGGAFDPAGGLIELTYISGQKGEIPLEKATVSGFDNTTPGQKTITVSYCGKTTEFEVEIMGDPGFSDVGPNDWFYSMVQFAKHKGLMQGDPEGTFRPDDSMTRAELVTMFYRLEGKPAHSGSNPFKDVSSNDWYYDQILWAAENGLVNGKEADRFCPTDSITRQELVTLFHRYVNKKGLDSGNRIDLAIFGDRATIDSWATDPVQWAVAEGLVVGIQEGAGMVFAPKSTATRAQVATIMMRYIQKYKVTV